VNVVTASPAARPPVVLEDGRPVAALQAVNLGAEKSVVVETTVGDLDAEFAKAVKEAEAADAQAAKK